MGRFVLFVSIVVVWSRVAFDESFSDAEAWAKFKRGFAIEKAPGTKAQMALARTGAGTLGRSGI